ncbi:MAG TPA: UDP-2,3-diacylglucosamine diphosphatase [Thermoanaerobaculia bacterium]|nr:UDP-2,3-diacylglucosamine diphosphatase [Thermoanaerobaculia bacterium]
MSVALIADAHLGGPGGPAEPLAEQLRALPRQGCDRLLLLGDLFHVWVGDRRYETEEIRVVVAALRELRRAAVWIGYVEGNRDFFLAGSPYADVFDALGTELALECCGRHVLAVHGDGLNDRDRRYRFWRWLSKSGPSRALFRRLPGPLARALVGGTERRLARTNFRHKHRIPDEVIRRYAQRRLDEGYELVLLGHFHEERRYPLVGGEARILPAWYERPEVVWLSELIGDAPARQGSSG